MRHGTIAGKRNFVTIAIPIERGYLTIGRQLTHDTSHLVCSSGQDRGRPMTGPLAIRLDVLPRARNQKERLLSSLRNALNDSRSHERRWKTQLHARHAVRPLVSKDHAIEGWDATPHPGSPVGDDPPSAKRAKFRHLHRASTQVEPQRRGESRHSPIYILASPSRAESRIAWRRGGR